MYRTCCERYMSQSSSVSCVVQFYWYLFNCFILSLVSNYDDKKNNIYSPNRFYLTFPHDHSWCFDKTLNIIKKIMFTLLYKYMIFSLFWLILISFFCLNHVKLFLLTVNKCKITIAIIISVKSFLERHFFRISINCFWK